MEHRQELEEHRGRGPKELCSEPAEHLEGAEEREALQPKVPSDVGVRERKEQEVPLGLKEPGQSPASCKKSSVVLIPLAQECELVRWLLGQPEAATEHSEAGSVPWPCWPRKLGPCWSEPVGSEHSAG